MSQDYFCRALGCKLSKLTLDGGHFTKNEISLNYNAIVQHGENVDMVCHTGYFLEGSSRLRCWYGEWSGGSVFGMPKCVGNPCNLPEISGTPGGKYVGK